MPREMTGGRAPCTDGTKGERADARADDAVAACDDDDDDDDDAEAKDADGR